MGRNDKMTDAFTGLPLLTLAVLPTQVLDVLPPEYRQYYIGSWANWLSAVGWWRTHHYELAPILEAYLTSSVLRDPDLAWPGRDPPTAYDVAHAGRRWWLYTRDVVRPGDTRVHVAWISETGMFQPSVVAFHRVPQLMMAWTDATELRVRMNERYYVFERGWGKYNETASKYVGVPCYGDVVLVPLPPDGELDSAPGEEATDESPDPEAELKRVRVE